MNKNELFHQLQLDADEPIDNIIHQLIVDYGFEEIERKNNNFCIRYKNKNYYLVQYDQFDEINLYFKENEKLTLNQRYSIFEEYNNIAYSISNRIKSKENKLELN